MLSSIRCSVRCVASRLVVAARPVSFQPVRQLSVPSFRLAGNKQGGSSFATPDEAAENNHPADLPLRVEADGTKWADYRAENLRNIQAVRNADGDLVGKFEGEEVIFPDLEPTLEWTLSTPVDMHLFEESPIIKMYLEESQ